MTQEELRERLHDLADSGYREFHLRTCPQAEHFLGVRIPEQRKLAKEITRQDYWSFLDSLEPYYYEEYMIVGIVIATASMGLAERLDYVAWFVPKLRDWATCDVFCASFKLKETDLKQVWGFIMQFLSSDREFELRFMLVMMLDHFLRPEYLERIFNLVDSLKSEHYYVNMAIAWLIAEALAKYRDETLEYLSRDQLSPATHNKAIQKARESRRISEADKQILLGMKL